MSNGYTQKTGYTVQSSTALQEPSNKPRKRPNPRVMNPGNMPTYQQDPPKEPDPGPWASASSARVSHKVGKFNEMPPGYMADAKNAFGNNPGSGIDQKSLDEQYTKVPFDPWEPMYTNEPAYGGYQNFTGEPEYSGGFVERGNVLDRE
jgi:hypothetical protein